MSTWGWAPSLIVVLLVIGLALWVFGEIAHEFGTRDDYDWLAEHKRRIARRGYNNGYKREIE